MNKHKIPRLILGTAQFGQHYGITNSKGKLSQNEILSILDYCIDNGVDSFDTAPSYSDSEEILGRILPRRQHININSKFQIEPNNFTCKEIINSLDLGLERSLSKLMKDNLDTYYLHRPSDIKSKYSSLIVDWLLKKRKEGLINKIGISIYRKVDLEGISKDIFDVIQLPISIYDQRLLDNNYIYKLSNKGYELHARSIFLQGLILSSERDFPGQFSSGFSNHHTKFVRYCRNKSISQLEIAISFIRNLPIDSIIIGTTTQDELAEIIKAWKTTKCFSKVDYDDFSWQKTSDIDPRKWIANK